MKRIITVLLIFILGTSLKAQEQVLTQIIDSAFENTNRIENAAKAQVPYRGSIGGMLPYTSNAQGPSFKAFFNENVAFQTDLLFKVAFTGGKDVKENRNTFVFYFSIEANVNIVYQKKLKEKEKTDLYWLIGGGMSLGHQLFLSNGKFGLNTIIGLEYVYKKKNISLQFDVRPGYGLLYNLSETNINTPLISFSKNPWSHFDWMMGLTLRYTFKDKNIKK
jgi:hypothetical protein